MTATAIERARAAGLDPDTRPHAPEARTAEHLLAKDGGRFRARAPPAHGVAATEAHAVRLVPIDQKHIDQGLTAGVRRLPNCPGADRRRL